MVHSSSAPSMPTTPSVAPPPPPVVLVQVPPADHDLNQAAAKPLTPTQTPGSLAPQPPTPSPIQVKQPAPTNALTPAKPRGPTPTQTPAPLPPPQATVNGRTSGRKRTPKACDCCGRGGHHDDPSPHAKTPGRGRGRGRGSGRGGGRGRGTLTATGRNQEDPSKKKNGRGRPKKVKIIEITDDDDDDDDEDEDEDEDSDDQKVDRPTERNLEPTPKKKDGRGRPRKVKIVELMDLDQEDEAGDDQKVDKPMTTEVPLAAEAMDQSGIFVDTSITTTLGDGPMRNCGVEEGAGAQVKEQPVVAARGSRGASAGRARGRGTAANSKTEVNLGISSRGGRKPLGRGVVSVRGQGSRVTPAGVGVGDRGRGGVGVRGQVVRGRGSVEVRGQGARGRGSVEVRGQGARGRGGVGLRGQGARGRGSVGVGDRGRGGVGARGQGLRGRGTTGTQGRGRGEVAVGSAGVGIQRAVSSNLGCQTGSGTASPGKNAISVDVDVEEKASSTAPPENGNGVGDAVVKSACVRTAASGRVEEVRLIADGSRFVVAGHGSAGGTATAGTGNAVTPKSPRVAEPARVDSPSHSGQVTGSNSTSESPQGPDTVMQVDSQSPNDDMVPLSNGSVSALTEEHVKAPPPPPEDSIVVHTTQHRWALRDHRLYCVPGTWEKGAEEEEVQAKEPSEQTDGQQTEKQTDGQSQEKDDTDAMLTEMIHEFLESFYTKYGSFIPLSETDVVEHLKKKSNSDLSNRKLNIPAEVSRYRAGLASAPVGGFMVTYNKHTLSLEDLGTLEEQNWLNDQIINMYGELIMEATQHKVHFFNSFFHRQLVAKGYEGVKRWTKKEDLFSKKLLLVPIHLEIHWSLIAVDIATKTISYYDSQGIVFKHTIDNIMKYIQAEAKEKEQTDFQKGWKMVIIKGIPQQKNDSDCGVFVLEYCRRLSVKQALLFSQEDMPLIRKRIYKELCECRLND